jgi:hypothetical protein
MGMNNYLRCCFTLLFVTILFLSPAAMGFLQILPSEPGEENLVNEDINIVTGLYTREYSLHNNGIVDYRTARQIIRADHNDYGDTVVDATPHPLFYWYDENGMGAFSMWIDPEGRGCLCDIVPYDIALAGEPAGN